MNRGAVPILITAAAAAAVAFAFVATSPAASAATIRVDRTGGGDFLTIQQGIDAASEGDTVLVSVGTYTGPQNRNLDFGGTNIRLAAQGIPGSVVIDCQGAGRGFYFHSGEDSTSVVAGLTVANGFASDRGGGLYCEESDPKFVGVNFIGNHAGTGSVEGYGGGAFAMFCAPTIVGCQFEGNTADDGGGMFCWHSPARITDCLFYDNHGSHGGGGVRILYQPAVLTRVTFIGNTAPTFGGGVYCCYSAPIITNCTFWRNGAVRGGAIYGYDAAPTITNSIVAGCVTGSAFYCPGASNFTIAGSCVYDNAGGDTLCGNAYGNISADPAFCNESSTELWLQECSPCVGAGLEGADIGARGVGCVCFDPSGIDDGEPGDDDAALLLVPSPNPFAGSTRILYDAPAEGGPVRISVHNLRGQHVRTLVSGTVSPGRHEISWDGTDDGARPVSSGVYFLMYEGGDLRRARKLLVAR